VYALLIPTFFYWLGRRVGWFIVPVLSIVAAHALVHWVALLSRDSGAQVPYACLAVGVVLWAMWLRRAGPVEAVTGGGAARRIRAARSQGQRSATRPARASDPSRSGSRR
jgi:hypothetical protein